MTVQEDIESKKAVLEQIKEIIGTPVPVEVKHPEWYLEHLRLKNNPIHRLKLTIGDRQIPISHPYPVIKKAMAAANIAEDEPAGLKILGLKKKQMQTMMHSNTMFRKAYGKIVDNSGQVVEIRSIFDPVKEKLIMLFGRMFTVKEIHEICVTEWKLNVKSQALTDFRLSNVNEINKLIEEHQRTYSDIRLGHKRSRLEELVWLYNSRKRIFDVTKKADDHRLLLATLNQIKQEAEGDVIRIDGNVDININSSIEQHIQQNLMKTIGIKEIIMGRVAAKINIPVTRVIEALNQGYYRRVIDTQDVEHEVMPSYPSTQNYDFDRIKAVQAQKDQIKEIQKTTDAVKDLAKTAAGTSLQALLLKKLASKAGDINYAKNTMNNHYPE